MDRRTFLKVAGGTAGALFMGTALSKSLIQQALASPSPALARYQDPLPVPGVVSPVGKYRGADLYEIRMSQFTQQLHSQLAPTTVWGYNGSYPGPTIEAKVGNSIWVKWINDLPQEHLLPIDHNLHGAMDTPDVRTVVHLHGGHVLPENDGFPEAWFTPGNSATFFYPNKQRAAPLWYHDHSLGITRLNVYAGLAGLYMLRDSIEDTLRLPGGKYEIPLVIQDRFFNDDGSLFYPPPPWEPELFADTILVNGKVWPFLSVEPRKYRFRIYNGSNARFYNMKLSSGQPFFQIGGEGGLFPAPVKLNEILIAPGERADIVIDFSKHKGQEIILTNDAPAPFPMGDPADPETTGQIMQFRVNLPLSGFDNSSLPPVLRSVSRINEKTAVKVRDLTLEERLDKEGNPIMLLLNGSTWDDPITEKPKLGTNEIWRLVNLTVDTHPIHLHLVMFQVLGRQPFNVASYKAFKEANGVNPPSVDPYLTGTPSAPSPNEMGWKDTVRANPGEVTRIIAPFTDFRGKYVWHCHILEHEDNEMMRPYEVV